MIEDSLLPFLKNANFKRAGLIKIVLFYLPGKFLSFVLKANPKKIRRRAA